MNKVVVYVKLQDGVVESCAVDGISPDRIEVVIIDADEDLYDAKESELEERLYNEAESAYENAPEAPWHYAGTIP